MVWANDNATLFYTVKDQLDRPYKVLRHTVGQQGKDVVGGPGCVCTLPDASCGALAACHDCVVSHQPVMNTMLCAAHHGFCRSSPTAPLPHPLPASHHHTPTPLTPQEVYEETDDAFYVGLSRSRSEQLLFISSGSAVTSEERWLKADDPTGGQ
jgi:protease II